MIAELALSAVGALLILQSILLLRLTLRTAEESSEISTVGRLDRGTARIAFEADPARLVPGNSPSIRTSSR